MKIKKKYVENSDLYEELTKLQKDDIVTNDLHEMFLLMSTKISMKAMYKDKPYRDDMVQSAYIKCVKKAHMFDMNKSNPFAYFQSMIENYFKDHIYKYEKDRQFLIKLSIKTHNDLANEFNLYHATEEIIVESEYNTKSFNSIQWKTSFLDFLLLSDVEFPTLELKIQNYFVDEKIDVLLNTLNSEIIYLNYECDNIDGHCLCDACSHCQFENKYGKLIMNHRQVLLDMKGL
jgi:DNA-directed RNA polymerase specialized sigma24 family protein